MSTNMTTSESESITEGSTTIYVTNAKSTDVFYNPVQQFNRDMSIAVINQFVKDRENDEVFKEKGGLTILESLSATGLRSIRYHSYIT
jgi:tRNA (guanine26-N2/guanine27-N2)-dimethyltransferase